MAPCFSTPATVMAARSFCRDINSSPTGISLSANTVPGNEAAGTTVASLSTADPNLSSETFTYSLVDTVDYPDDSAFTIAGNQLLSNTAFNYLEQSSYTILHPHNELRRSELRTALYHSGPAAIECGRYADLHRHLERQPHGRPAGDLHRHGDRVQRHARPAACSSSSMVTPSACRDARRQMDKRRGDVRAACRIA